MVHTIYVEVGFREQANFLHACPGAFENRKDRDQLVIGVRLCQPVIEREDFSFGERAALTGLDSTIAFNLGIFDGLVWWGSASERPCGRTC